MRRDKISIQWSLPNFVAIDNITFAGLTLAEPIVPEPATLVSWMLGVVLSGLSRIVDVVWRVARLANRHLI